MREERVISIEKKRKKMYDSVQEANCGEENM